MRDIKKVFVRPVDGAQVYYPVEGRFIKAEGELVPARSRYWKQCQEQGLLTISEQEPEPPKAAKQPKKRGKRQ